MCHLGTNKGLEHLLKYALWQPPRDHNTAVHRPNPSFTSALKRPRSTDTPGAAHESTPGSAQGSARARLNTSGRPPPYPESAPKVKPPNLFDVLLAQNADISEVISFLGALTAIVGICPHIRAQFANATSALIASEIR